MIRFTVFLLLLVCVPVGCGGGGGGPAVRPPIEPPVVEEPTISVDWQTRPALPAEEIARYLGTHASGGPWRSGPDFTWSHDPGLVRFSSPPTVRMARTTTEHERALAHYAVALINRALPYERHLTIGADAPTGIAGEWEDGLPNIPDGQIVVEFLSSAPQGGRPGTEALGHQDVQTEYDASQARWEKTRLRAASVEMDRRVFHGRPDHQTISVLVHELLHGLGLQGHVSGEDFPDSNMYDAWRPITGRLPAIDATGLQTLYGRLAPKTDPEDISADTLGPWDRDASVLMGRVGAVSFGVTHHNGVAQPWTAGIRPLTDLAENAVLHGTVTWDGGLVGFTSDQEPMAGETTISINIGTLTGRAEFTDLQSWPANATPGQLGTGITWGDGTLGYDLTVSGNFLRSTGGDAGAVSGTFYGAAHEGVAGTLERADLTAAFGANRQ